MIDIDYIGIHYVNDKDFIVNHPDGLPHFFLMLFLTDIYISDHTQTTRHPAGTVLLYTPGTPQFYTNSNNGFSNDWIQFWGEDVFCLLDQINFPLNTPFLVQEPDLFHDKFKRIEEEFFMPHSCSRLMTDALLRELLLLLAREQKEENSLLPPAQETRLREVHSYILSHLEEPWSLESMAALMDISPSRFSHIYTSVFHISPKHNLVLERINKAKFLIESQNYTITEAAALVGYNNLYHFSKQFHRITGRAPSDFRKNETF